MRIEIQTSECRNPNQIPNDENPNDEAAHFSKWNRLESLAFSVIKQHERRSQPVGRFTLFPPVTAETEYRLGRGEPLVFASTAAFKSQFLLTVGNESGFGREIMWHSIAH